MANPTPERCPRCHGTGAIHYAHTPPLGPPPRRPHYERLSYYTMTASCLCRTIGAQAVAELDQ